MEFELVRVVAAPIEHVFDRLSDIEHDNDWMPRRGSIFRSTEQISPGEPQLGTTYADRTAVGTTPGEIVEFERPTRLAYHWRNTSRSGRTTAEGWPGYTLEAQDEGTTILRHRARLVTRGIHRLATPMYRRLALRERTATVEALQASFGATR